MFPIQLSDAQQSIVEREIRGRVFLQGPAGTGKTTAAIHRLRFMLKSVVPANQVLVLTAQRTLAQPYLKILEANDLPPGGVARVTTLGGLARQMIGLFFPLVASSAGFKNPHQPPTFLSLETAQYYMARVLNPEIDARGLFASIIIDRNRLFSQILDNLNKSALVGFDYQEIGARLKSAVLTDEEQKRVYDDVQHCANIFRAYCLEHNLLDFSLQAELFTRNIWPLAECKAYLQGQYRHIIYDNAEEDNPASHDLMTEWLGSCESALVIFDEDASYRKFLGADEITALQLRDRCDETIRFETNRVSEAPIQALGEELAISLKRQDTRLTDADVRQAIFFDNNHYYPELIDNVAMHITRLVHDEGVSPREIVVIAPYVSDALQFALTNRLKHNNVPIRSHRPSRALRQESSIRCLLTLAQLAHPTWRFAASSASVTQMLMTVIADLDLVRAQLLASYAYRAKDLSLQSFENIPAPIQSRITYRVGELYERLRVWLIEYQTDEPLHLDHFWSRLFGEVLSQAGFGFHADFNASQLAANLIDSAFKFRQSVIPPDNGKSLALEYIEMVQNGVIADQYLRNWDLSEDDAVLIAPAYTFLMRNTPVDYQFWMSIGAAGWSERLYQPLTHPYVLSRTWPLGRLWTDQDDVNAASDALYRLVTGLTRRCRKAVYLGYSNLSDQGTEQRGLLLDSVQKMFLRLSNTEAG